MTKTMRLEKEGLTLSVEAQAEINDVIEAVSEVNASKISNKDLAEFFEMWEYWDYDEYANLFIPTKRGRERTAIIKEHLQATINLIKEVNAELELERNDIFIKY